MGRPLVRERAHEPGDARLRCRVRDDVDPALEAQHRRGEDDLAGSALDHRARELACEHELRRQVRLQHAPPLLVVVHQRRCTRDRPRVVDEDVDLEPVAEHRGGQLRCPVLRAEIGAVGGERPPVALDARLRLAAGGVDVEARADDVGAGGGERFRHRQPDPAPAARDERDLAGQVEAHPASPAQSTRIFIARPGVERLECGCGLGEGDDVGDESVDGDLALGEQADRVVEVGTFVDPRTDDRELAPEDAEEVDRGRRGVDRDDDEAAARAERIDCALDARDGARHLEGHLGAGALRPLLDVCGDLALARVERRQPDDVGQLSAGVVRLDEEDVGPRFPCDRRHEQPDRPASDDDRALPGGELGPADVVDGDGRRLRERGGAQRHVRRERYERVGRDGPARLERSGRVDPEEGETLADVRDPATARRALAAPDERHDRHGVALPPVRDAVADSRDMSGHLVAENRGRADASIHRAVDDVEIGAADPGVRDFDLRHPRGGRDGFGRADLDPAVAGVEGGVHHRVGKVRPIFTYSFAREGAARASPAERSWRLRRRRRLRPTAAARVAPPTTRAVRS